MCGGMICECAACCKKMRTHPGHVWLSVVAASTKNGIVYKEIYGYIPLWLNSRTCVWYVMCIWCNFCSNSCCPGRARGLLVAVSVRQNGVINNVWLMLSFWTCWCGFTSQVQGRQSTDSTGATSSPGGLRRVCVASPKAPGCQAMDLEGIPGVF